MLGGRPYSIAALALGLAASAIGAAVALIPDGEAGQSAVANQRGAVTADFLDDLLALSEDAAFERPTGPWTLSLPEDHGGHPAARAETWMIAAHLEDESGAPLGLTFSLSRFGLRATPPAPEDHPWELRALYRGHVTLAMDGEAIARSEERFSRGAGAAGHDAGTREVWLDHWELTYGVAPDGDGLSLVTSVDGLPISISLTPVKRARPIDGGDATPLRGFTMPRMAVEGVLGAGDRETRVHGIAWLDRFWGELPFPGGPLAYGRLIIQLDDGTDVSVLRSQRRDGRGGATLDGVIVDPSGSAETLSEDMIEMAAVENWTPDRGTPTYPIGWRIEGAGLDLEVRPLTANQEQDFVLPGWNGIVTVTGRRGGKDVTGLGTLQLTGYDEP